MFFKQPKPQSERMTYKAFISYNHAADDNLAPALQSGLQSFAKPWHSLRAVHIFRDKTTLAVTPELWPSIQAALDDSEYFLLLASIESCKSLWVQREVDHWMQHRSSEKLLIIITSSSPLLPQDAPLDFDWIRENLLPGRLGEELREEPLYLDLRWVKSEEELSVRNPRFLNEIASLSATLTNRPKDELIGEDVKQHRRLRRMTWAAVLGLVLLSVASLIGAVYATWQRDLARARQLVATSATSQDSDAELSVLFAAEAVSSTWRWGHTVLPEAEEQLHHAVMASRVMRTLTGHSQPIRAVAWSPDGTRLATAGEEGSAKVWDMDSGREILKLVGHTNKIVGVAWSPDGGCLATASWDKTVRVWDAASGRELHKFRQEDGATSVAWSPDGQQLASGWGDGKAIVWDVARERVLLTLPGFLNVLAVAWSASGDRLATGEGLGNAEIWDGKSGKRLLKLGTNDGSDNVFGVAWSPDGRRLATTSVTGAPRIWDAVSGAQLQALQGHTSSVWAVAWSPDGKRLATGSWDYTAKTWDPDTGKEVLSLGSHSNAVVSVAWSRDGKRLATGSYDRTAKVWNMGVVSEVVGFFGHVGEVGDVAWSLDGRRLATVGDDKTARVWDSTNGKELATMSGHQERIDDLAWSSDGRQLATASGLDNRIIVWDAASGQLLDSLPGPYGIVAWSPDGKRLATGDSGVTVFDAESRKELVASNGVASDPEILCIAWSPDSSRLATGDQKGAVKVWDAGGKVLQTLKGHENEVFAVAWSPGGERLATSGGDGKTNIWRVSDGKLLLSLNVHGLVGSLAWSPDAKRLVMTRGDRKVAVVEVASGRELLTLGDRDSRLNAAAWSPDGTRLAVTSEEGIVSVYTMDIHDLMAIARKRVTAYPSLAGCKQYLHLDACPAFPQLSLW
jgi:WD40 repeat protein